MPNPSSSTGSFVTISQAQTMISNWDNQQVSINDANPRSIAYGKSKILDILNQSGCEGIRIYNGIDQSNHVFILVGYDSNGNDMTSGYILETGLPCPSYCAPSTSLG
ncbi:MAG: hypothetical protein IPO62_17970 [Saprospiraceae bacterium]|nr:hypothetical protein [Saprospiraceae bacterium]